MISVHCSAIYHAFSQYHIYSGTLKKLAQEKKSQPHEPLSIRGPYTKIIAGQPFEFRHIIVNTEDQTWWQQVSR